MSKFGIEEKVMGRAVLKKHKNWSKEETQPLPLSLELSEAEQTELESFLHDSMEEGESYESFDADLQALRLISNSIKSIQKQSLLLLGEQVSKARSTFQRYARGDLGFTRWLQFSFQSKKTAYNVLGYYELHRSLASPKLQEKLEQMPAKASYVLAARAGDLKVKKTMIRNYKGETALCFIEKLNEKLPPANIAKPSSQLESKKQALEGLYRYLQKYRQALPSKERKALHALLLAMVDLVK